MIKKADKKRNASFWYFNSNHIPSYKAKVENYLQNLEESLINEFPYLLIDLYDLNKRENKKPTGHLFAIELPEGISQMENLYHFLLSKERLIKPLGVICSKKEDYSLIDEILKKNYDKEGKLKNYFWRFGKTIKIPQKKRIKTLDSI